MKVLITGAGRGLGKFLYKQFPNADTLTRKDNVKNYSDTYDLIIHCAANVSHLTWSDEIPYSYYYDNILLTRDVISIPHKRFVYISSIAAVPDTHTVDAHKTSPYGISKRISESIVETYGCNYQIIRPTGLLGTEMKKNTFQKILHNEPIALTSDSIMNYILYDDVLDVINSDMRGVITVSGTESITMQEVADIVGHDIEFGSIYFNINSDSFTSILKKSSAENVIKYIKKYER